MDTGEVLVEVTRAGRVESIHCGHAVICDGAGDIVEAIGSPDLALYPRSSCKMVQALPLVESGAAEAFGLSEAELALACASHTGAPIHTGPVGAWLARIGCGDSDLVCGPELPRDQETQYETIRSDATVCRIHNNCSGKHTGFLTLAKHLAAGLDYADPDHPVQRAVKSAFEEVTGEASPGFGIDGCSAPNFVTSLHGLARAMAGFASAGDTDARGRAQRRLFTAMVRHPELVAGEGTTDTALMRAAGGRIATKGGAEGVHIAIIPERELGIALKVSDGTARASECAMTALLVKLGVLDGADPLVRRRLTPDVVNRRGTVVGEIRPAAALAR